MPDTRRDGEYGQRRRSTSPGERGNGHGERRTEPQKKMLEPTTTTIITIIITIPTQIKSDINNNNPTSYAA